jgi:hypothetical protein
MSGGNIEGSGLPPAACRLPPAGWHTDPADPSRERWWAGQNWTEHLRARAIAPVAPGSPVGWFAPPVPTSPAAYKPMDGWGEINHARHFQPRYSGSPNTVPIWLIAAGYLPFIVAYSVITQMLPIAQACATGGFPQPHGRGASSPSSRISSCAEAFSRERAPPTMPPATSWQAPPCFISSASSRWLSPCERSTLVRRCPSRAHG